MTTTAGSESFKDLFESAVDTDEIDEARKKEGIFYFFKKVKELEIEVEKKFVSVMGIELEVNTEGEGTQYAESEFRDFALDKMSKDLLKRYATAAKLDQPILIEGETDIGKTKALEYLAFLTNNYIERINLSGQTDVSEFIGRFVPSEETVKQRFLKALANPKGLKDESRQIIEQAKDITRDGAGKEVIVSRQLTEDESQRIAVLEGIPMGDSKWIWQDGKLLRAMKAGNGRGTWFYIDEMGGAEPSILMRINPVFEKPRRMPVSERGGLIEKAGPNFRLFATTNPPEYAGNEPFRPDYLRRWVYQSLGGLDKQTIDARLAHLMRGLFPEKPEIGKELRKLLVEFHILAKDSLKTLIKQRQVFRYEFSDLARVMEYVDNLGTGDVFKAAEEAIWFYYLNKFSGDTEKTTLLNLWLSAEKGFNTKKKIAELSKDDAVEKRKTLAEITRIKSQIMGDPNANLLPSDVQNLIKDLTS